MSKKLYDWQEECLDKWFANNCRGMVQAVTGSGKTLLALTAIARLEQQLGQKLLVRIVVPTAALMRQWNRDLRDFSPTPARISERKLGCAEAAPVPAQYATI